MSETYPTELEPTISQLPMGQHSETFVEESEIDDEALRDRSEATDVDQSVAAIALIGENEIKAFQRDDRDVHERYRDAKADIAAAYAHETAFHEDVTAKIVKDKADAQEAFRIRSERLEESERLLIAMITQEFTRRKQHAALKHYGRMTDLQEKEILQTSLFKSNEATFKFVEDEIDAGEGQQAQLEDRRERAIEYYNMLVSQKNMLVQEADGIEKDITVTEKKKYILERSKKKHISDEAGFQYSVDEEVGQLVGASIHDMCIERGVKIEYDENGSIVVASLPAGIQALIPSIMDKVKSSQLTTHRDNLKICQEKICVVSDEIYDLDELIAGKKLLLDDIYLKLEQLDPSIDKLKAELEGILHSTSQHLVAHSNEATTLAWQLKQVLQGDTSAIVINELHSTVQSVAKNVRTWETLLDSNNDDINKEDMVDDEDELPFSEVFGKLLKLDESDDVAAMIDGQTDLISNIENGAQVLDAVRSHREPDFTRMIQKGGVFRRGVAMKIGEKRDNA